MSRGDVQVNLRIPVEMRQSLKEAAQANKRSMNAEAIARLEMSFFSEETKSAFAAIADLKNAAIFSSKAALDQFRYVQSDCKSQPLYWRPPTVRPVREGEVLIRRHGRPYVLAQAVPDPLSGFYLHCIGIKDFDAWAYLPDTRYPLIFDLED